MAHLMTKTQYKSAPAEEQITAEIHIDTSAIPAHVRDNLAASTLELIHAILRQPGGREALDARTAARKERYQI